MFIKNIFRNKIKKINKKQIEQVKQILNKPEYILFNFSENVYLPEASKDEEIVHTSCSKYCSLLRKIRDNPEVFIDHLKKYGLSKTNNLNDESLKFYIDKKLKTNKSEINKLLIDENINNIKLISNRIKNCFVVNDTNESALKIFDNKNAYIFFEFNEDVNYKMIDKIKNASVVILANKNNESELKKRNYQSFNNNLFYKI